MASENATRPNSGDDGAALRASLAEANVPTLLLVLVQLTGDERWLQPPYTPTRTRGMSDNDSGGLPENVQAEVRAAAADAIFRWGGGHPMAIPEPSPDLVVRMLGTSLGDDVPVEYGDYLTEELRVGTGRPRRRDEMGSASAFRAVVIGAGVSGIATSIMLRRLGIEHIVLEKGDDLGGVWRDNRYPAAAVDTPSHLYEYSFAPHDWTRYFASRQEIHDYLKHVAKEHGVLDDVHLGTDVLHAAYREEETRWHVRARTPDGDVVDHIANVVVSCAGAFNPPVIPAILGLEQFTGPAFHTAEWPEDLTLEGRRVAVIGTGASAMQVVPAIAPSVAHLTVFQRSPQWAQPFEKFQKDIPPATRLLLDEVPLFRAWYRLRLNWIFHDKIYSALQRDPRWQGADRAINSANDRHREYMTDYIKAELAERPDLWDRTVPTYPPFGKRMLFDNGWFRTLTRDNVTLVTEDIAEATTDGLVTASGDHHKLDAIVFATGFDVARFISSYEVIGRDGRRLRETWNDDDCRAYLGLTVPGFPNFFTVYGPNTQTGHGGSLTHTVEAQLDYLGSLLVQMAARDIAAVECREEVYWAYANTVDDKHERMVWTHPAMTTYYRNSQGRVVVINPFTNLEYWQMTRQADLTDYVTTSATGRGAGTTVAGDREPSR